MLSKTSGIKTYTDQGSTEVRQSAGRKGMMSTLCLAMVGVGGAILVSTAFELITRETYSDLDGRFCLPLAVGVAVIVWGALIETTWKSFGAWLGLALAGQAASLQMINAGRLIHFQHYRSVSEILETDAVALTLLILQFICVGVGVSSRLQAIIGWIRAQFASWKVFLILVFLAFASAAVTPDISIYGRSLAMGSLVQLVNVANVILLAWSVPDEDLPRLRAGIDRFFGRDRRESAKRLDRFSLITALWIVVLTGSLSYFVYQAHPHVPDETQYVFQAKYMAAGQLSVKPPAVPEAFALYMVPYCAERWFGIFPPGWPALLAVGTFLSAGWLVNPILAGFCILLAYLLFQQLYSRRAARMAILLLSCSPWLVFMGMSYMSHVSTLAFALAAGVLMIRGVRTQNAAHFIGTGLLVGVIFLIRPLDGAIVGMVLGIGALFCNKTWKARILGSIALSAGCGVSAALVLPYNKLVTGHAVLSPSDAYYNDYVGPRVMALGFGPERGMHWPLDAFPGHSPLEAVINSALNVFQLNTELFGWGTGSIVLIVLLLVAGRSLTQDLWAWATIAAVTGAYSFFWYHGGPDFGARYWFLCLVPLVALTVKGVEWVATSMKSLNADGSARARVPLAVGALCLISLITYIPWRATDKYFAYLRMQPGILELAQQHKFGRSLVLIRGSEHPDFESAWIYNSPGFEGEAPIYAFDRSPEIRAELLRSYRDRTIWIVEGPTVANGKYRVIQGPLLPGESPAQE